MNDNPSPDTRERLLRAAMEVFARHGYEAATVREICHRAQANVAAVNYHFGDKKNLYAAIFDGLFKTLHAVRTPFLPPGAPPEARLKTYIQAFFDELFYCDEDGPDCTCLSAMYLMEMARPTEALDNLVRDYIASDVAELHDIVGRLLGEGAGEPDVVNCAASIAGQILYYYHAEPLIERLNPALAPSAERIGELTRHVFAFSLGGIAAFAAPPDTAQASS